MPRNLSAAAIESPYLPMNMLACIIKSRSCAQAVVYGVRAPA